MLGDREVRERVDRLRMGDRVESAHQPVKVWIKGGWGRRGEKREKRKKKGVWKEGRKEGV